MLFSTPVLIKGGEVVVEDGQIRAVTEGRQFLVQPSFDEQISEFLRPVFQKVYTMSFDNYPVELERIRHPEVVKLGIGN